MAFSWFKQPVRDDRGNAVELLLTRTEGRAEWPVSGDERIERVRERLEAALGRSTSVPLPGSIPAFALFTIGAAFFVLSGALGRFSRVIWLFSVAMIGMMVAMVVLGRRSVSAYDARIATDLLLQEGLCPGCGYNLVGLGPEPDHMVICPECGGAWRDLRIIRAAPFVQGVRMGPALPRVSWSWPGLRAERFDFDDRNRQVRLVRPRLRRQRATATSDAHAARLAAAADKIARTGGSTRWAIAATVGAFGPVLGLIFAYAAWHNGVSSAGTYAAIIGALSLIFLIVGAVLASGTLTVFARDIIAAMKGEGQCPSCGAMLDVMRPLEDGCVECPACGAAWRARAEAGVDRGPRE